MTHRSPPISGVTLSGGSNRHYVGMRRRADSFQLLMVQRIAEPIPRNCDAPGVGFPSWGAWTVRGGDDPAVTHARFMPNAYARPDLATTAMHYDYLRSQWAQEKLVPADIVEAVRAGRRQGRTRQGRSSRRSRACALAPCRIVSQGVSESVDELKCRLVRLAVEELVEQDLEHGSRRRHVREKRCDGRRLWHPAGCRAHSLRRLDRRR